jgi:hypothetical protein
VDDEKWDLVQEPNPDNYDNDNIATFHALADYGSTSDTDDDKWEEDK